MKVINTSTFSPDDFSNAEILWIYNGLDCMLTEEVRTIIEPKHTRETQLVYDFELAMQAPALEMCLRGIKIDLNERNKRVAELEAKVLELRSHLDLLADAVWGRGLNPASPKQMKEFFYEALKCPRQWKFDKGQRKVTTDRSAMEKLVIRYDAKIFCQHVMRIRDLNKTCGTLRTAVDDDGRMRTLYAVAGTETGRWSSRANAFGSGTNLQNISDPIRSIFIADEGYKLAYIDLEQAESRAVAYLADDDNYIRACESGDLHSTVCDMVWPGSNPKEIFYRDMSRRDTCKRLGHGTNYWGKAPNMAKQTHIDKPIVASFQEQYFEAFPGIPIWHQDVIHRLQTDGFICSPFGRKRKFWDRLSSDSTIREAIASDPQGMIGDILNTGMYRIWKYGKLSKLLAQIHDAVLITYREEDETEALAEAMRLITVETKVHGRPMIIPAAIEGVGWNWQKAITDKNTNEILGNPDGLYDLKGRPEFRERTSFPPTSILDQRIF